MARPQTKSVTKCLIISVFIHLLSKASVLHTTASGLSKQENDTMKTKELSKQVRDNVVGKYETGLGYKKISQTLNITKHH